MAELNPSWAIGEYRGDAKLCDVEYAGTIAAGDLLKITGWNSAGQPKVVKATADDKAHFVAVQNGDGKNGEIHDVLLCGFIKLGTPAHATDTNLTNLKDGKGVSLAAGTLAATGSTGAGVTFAYAWQGKPAVGDTGILVFFNPFG